MRFASRASRYFDPSQSLISQANVVLRPVVSKRVIGPAPLLPANIDDQVSSAVLPIGVTKPTPVITTRRRMDLLSVRLHVVECVFDRLDLLGIFVWNFNIEFLFES